MNHDEAKLILLRYRPGTKDEEDPEIREALALAKGDAGLSGWLAKQVERQQLLRETFREIKAPAGLAEQIISEQMASQRMLKNRRRFERMAVAAALLMAAFILGFIWHGSRRPADDTLVIFENQMAGYALRGYTMDLQTNDAGEIRAFFRREQAPSDYTLSRPLQKATLIGCSVETWQSTKVSMICFATGAPLAPGTQNDLWLFVVDQKSVVDAPPDSQPHLSHVNRLTAATWSENGKLYLLATTVDEPVFRKLF